MTKSNQILSSESTITRDVTLANLLPTLVKDLGLVADVVTPAPAPVIDRDAFIIAPILFAPRKPTKHSGKQHEILSSFIAANPGVARLVIFSDAGLLAALRTPASVALIAAGDKAETKRWNRRLNFLIRDMRRADVDIRIHRIDGSACYTILGSTVKELPFSKPVPRTFVNNVNAAKEDLAPASFIAIDFKRAEEPQDVMLSFEDLLAQLDNDEAAVTSDDQVAFKAAREMIK